MATREEWIADGTADSAPVTEVTPAVTPAAEATPVAATADTGQAAAAAIEAAGAGAPAVPPTPPAAPPASPVQEFIEAQLDGKPYQLPKGVMIPLKRGDTVEYEPLTEVQSRGMFERDYRMKTAEAAAQRRAFELEQARAAARVKAQEDFLAQRIKQLNTIPTSPEEQAKQIALAELAKNDPFIQKLFEDAQQGHVLQAEREVEVQQIHADREAAILDLVERDIARFADEFHIDPARLRDRYSFELTAGRAELHPDALKAIAQQEAQYRQSVMDSAVAPIQTKLDEVLAKVAAFEAAQAAASHNASTREAIARASNPVGAPPPAVGAPIPTPPASKITGATISERSRSWASQG